MNYDFDSILARLRGTVPPGISTMEGTFAGDLLQATAAELARIWSQEADTVTQRGFVTTAEGEWLDGVCGNYGIVRKSGESDDSLRQRTLDFIRESGSSGNCADYVRWATSLEGMAAARAVPLARGAGTVDVYFIPQEDADEGQKSRIEAFLEEKRPVGADVRVIRAEAVPLTVEASVTREGTVGTEEIGRQLERRLGDYLAQVRLTDAGRQISKNRLIGIAMGCDGVADIGQITVNGSGAGVTLPEGSYGVLQSVTVTEA